MSLTLRQKIESALTAYLQANASTIGLTSGQIVPGRTTAEPEGDWLCVICGQLSPDEDLPQVKRGTVTLHYRSAATKGGSERAAVDTILEKIDTFLMKPSDDNATWSDANPEAGVMRAALNKPASGTDSRTVQPLHLYHVGPSEELGDTETEGWNDQLTYKVVAQPMDSH